MFCDLAALGLEKPRKNFQTIEMASKGSVVTLLASNHLRNFPNLSFLWVKSKTTDTPELHSRVGRSHSEALKVKAQRRPNLNDKVDADGGDVGSGEGVGAEPFHHRRLTHVRVPHQDDLDHSHLEREGFTWSASLDGSVSSGQRMIATFYQVVDYVKGSDGRD